MAVDPATHLENLSNRSSDIRRAAAEALGAQRTAAAVGPLNDLLRDRDGLVRAAAVDALGQICQPESAPAVRAMLKDRNEWVRAAAAQALGRFVYDAAVPDLTKALKDGEYAVRGWSAWALGRFPAAHSTKSVVALLRDPVQWVRERAFENLASHWSPEVRNTLSEALSHRNSLMRWNIVRLMGQSGDAACAEPLLRLMQDHVVDVRLEVIRSLGKLGVRRAVQPLRQALERERLDTLRAAAASALGTIGGPEVVPLLAAAVRDESPWVRRNAAWALLHMNTAEARAALETLRDDDDGAAAFFASLGEDAVSGGPPPRATPGA